MFGTVVAGDFIPYVPMHQGALTLEADVYGLSVGVSHRPFGARPTKPTSFLIGFKQKF